MTGTNDQLGRDPACVGSETSECPESVQSQQRFDDQSLAETVVIRTHKPLGKIRALPSPGAPPLKITRVSRALSARMERSPALEA